MAATIQHGVRPIQNGRLPAIETPGRLPTLSVVNVEPSFTSSDLFTPFSAPRSTLPSIAQFVRPTYGKENTWGELTSNYGGVGPAADTFRKTNQGSISRSHRHYGGGCMTFHKKQQSYYSNVPQLPQMHDHCSTKQEEHPKTSPVTTILPDATPSESTSKAEVPPKRVTKITVAETTVNALESLYAQLYGISTYKKEFSNAKSCPMKKKSANISFSEDEELSQLNKEDTFHQDINPSQSNHHELNKSEEGMCDDDTATEVDDICEPDNLLTEPESEEESNCYNGLSLRGHAAMVVLPDHIAVNHLYQLPIHFRRITTKYTRNKCSTIPCNVPFYLCYKRNLLPSSITEIPSNCFSKSTDKSQKQGLYVTIEDSGMEKMSTSANPHNTPMIQRKQSINREGQLPNILNRVPHGHLKPLVRNKAIHQLGLKFRSQAHARFCSMYPDQVPDLRRTEKSSRRDTFFGHHATVFRG